MATNDNSLKYKNFVNDFIGIIAQEGIPESYPEFFINFLIEDCESLNSSSEKSSFNNFEEMIFENPTQEIHRLRFNNLITLKLFCHQALLLKTEFLQKTEESTTSTSWLHQPIVDFMSCWSLTFGKSDWLGILLEETKNEDQDRVISDFIWTCLFLIRISFSELRLKYQQHYQLADQEIISEISKSPNLNKRYQALKEGRKNSKLWKLADNFYQPITEVEKNVVNILHGAPEISRPERLFGIPACEVTVIEDDIIRKTLKIKSTILHSIKELIPEKEIDSFHIEDFDPDKLDAIDDTLDSLYEAMDFLNQDFGSRLRGTEDLFYQFNMKRFSISLYCETVEKLWAEINYLEKLIPKLEGILLATSQMLLDQIKEWQKNLFSLDSLMQYEGIALWVSDDDLLSELLEPNFNSANKKNIFRRTADKTHFEIKFNEGPLFLLPVTKGLSYIFHLIAIHKNSPNEISDLLRSSKQGLSTLDLEANFENALISRGTIVSSFEQDFSDEEEYAQRGNDLEKAYDRVNRVIRTALRHIRREDPKFASYLVPPKPNQKKGVLIIDQHINFFDNLNWIIN
jgi:hypothetical protein